MRNAKQKKGRHALSALGWREWVALPDLGIDGVKAKVDTGARTSALHAFFVKPYRAKGRDMVRFGVHPFQNRTDIEKLCSAEVIDQRIVTDSGGHREKRFVIVTSLLVCETEFVAEITLTDRDTMQFRMLLGRTALAKRFVVDPGKSYLGGVLEK